MTTTHALALAVSEGVAQINKFYFTATAGQTVFSGADDNAATLAIVTAGTIVALNGRVLELTSDYSISTTTVTLVNGAKVGDLLTVYVFSSTLLSVLSNQGQAIPNLSLTATVASNILTVAVKDAAGNDPSPGSSISANLRSTTAGSGAQDALSITGALSINTNATGATLGTANTVPFRLWVLLFNNGGTPVLALWQSVTGGASPTAIDTLDESLLQSTVAFTSGATSAGVFYTPNGITLTSKAFRILGYVDYSSGLTTAGTYASAPTTIQLFGPGTKKPGDIIQRQFKTDNISVTATTIALAGPAISISLKSAPNVVLGTLVSSLFGASGQPEGFLMRGGTGGTQVGVAAIATTAVITAFTTMGWDRPGTVSPTSYQGAVKLSSGTGNAVYGNVNVNPQNSLELQEIMV